MNGESGLDARQIRTRSVARKAISELFREGGTRAVTHQRVAARAGIGRATLYRHWPRPIDLVIEAIAGAEYPMLQAGRGPLRPWLKRQLRVAAEDLASAQARQFVAAIITAEETDHAIAELRERSLRDTIATLGAAIDRACKAGELDRRPDPGEMAATLLGSLIYHVSIAHSFADDDFIERLIDRALNVPPHTSGTGIDTDRAGRSASP